MYKPLVCFWAGAALIFSSAFAAEPSATAPNEWPGKMVVAKTPQVVLRERPDEQAATIRYSLHGVVLTVAHEEHGWLDVTQGWTPAVDVLPIDQAVDYFTIQLAQRESVFAYLGRARGWLQRGDAGRAQADVSEALRLEPQNARAILVRAKIADVQDRDDEALADYDRAAQLDPQDPLCFIARSYIWAGRADYDRAIADLTAAIALLPSDAQLWGQRGWCCASKRDFDRALSDFSEAIRLDPTDAFAYSRRAAMHLRRQQYDQALADAEAAVRLDPKMAHGFAVRGVALAAQGKMDEALRDFDESIRLDARDAYVHTQRGLLHFRQGNLDAAVLDFTQAIALNPGNAYAYYQRAGVWSSKGDNANAIVDLGEYLRLQPDAVDVWVVRGNLRMQANDDEALKDFNEALRLNPRHLGALLGQASIWEQQQEDEKALQALTAAIDVGPESADVYERRAHIRMSRGEHDLAIEDLSAALRVEPKNTDRLLLRAFEWSATGNVEKALEDCRAALAIDPKKLMAYYYMAVAHSRAGQPEQAIEDFDAALRIDPNDVEMRFLRAYELFNQGYFDRALAGVDEVIQAGKEVSKAYGWRGYFWMLREEWQKAIADYSEALRLKPADASLLARRATCWTEVNEFEKALRDAEEALRLDPKSSEAADARKKAIAAKNGGPKRAKPRTAAPQYEGDLVTGPDTAPLIPEYYIDLQGPIGLKLVFERPDSEQFAPPTVRLPFRLPMFDGAIMRFKLVAGEGDARKDLYVRLNSAQISPEHAALLEKTPPSFMLTEEDLDTVGSGTDVAKLLVLHHDDTHSAADSTKPEFEVLSSSPTRPRPELLAQARRRGAVVAEIYLSQRLLPTVLSGPPSEDQFVQFVINGHRGLMLAHESPVAGKFDDEPLPVPAYYSVVPGISLRFELTGASLAAAKPLYGLLTVSDTWPTELGPPGKTELHLRFSKADLEAAAAGNTVTHVLYLAKQAREQDPARIETMKSNDMPPGSDVVAEAALRGPALAIVKLSQELSALPARLSD